MAIPPLFAACVFKFIGTLHLEQMNRYEPVSVYGALKGLTPGKHGMHIHMIGNIEDNCKAAAGHYNPLKKFHGGLNEEESHAGDFGNIEVNDRGFIYLNTTLTRASLYFPTIIGRSIVVHAGEDDLGRGNNEGSIRNGNSGDRVDCCVIGVSLLLPAYPYEF